ncbi:MAG: hypothetical protein J4473_00095 [Candidatus Aenigmarchaeota archaeon]|nr:hypothetical protein [Candidatus Aenigmarchaeota archaeon]
MKIHNIDFDELKKQKQRNFEERLKFIEQYAEWMKTVPNKEWSSQQKRIIR